MSKLQDALNQYQTTLNQAYTAQDQAVNGLIQLLIGEVQTLHNEIAVLRRDGLLQTPSVSEPIRPSTIAQPEEFQTLLNTIQEMRIELTALRRDMLLIQQLSVGSNHGHEDAPRSRHPSRFPPPIPRANVAPMHPVEELLDEAATLDTLTNEASNERQLVDYINRQRVRPEDIQLTEAEIQRLQKPKPLRYESNNTLAKLSEKQYRIFVNLIVIMATIIIVSCIVFN